MYGAYESWDYCGCGKRKKAVFPVCWQCKQEAEQQAAYRQGAEYGYRVGWEHGQAAASAPKLDAQLVRRLLQLCHPDKHNGSQTATEVTQWLLQQR